MSANEETFKVILTANEMENFVLRDQRDTGSSHIPRLGYHHGLRPSEISSLQFADYEHTAGMALDHLGDWTNLPPGGRAKRYTRQGGYARRFVSGCEKEGASGPSLPIEPWRSNIPMCGLSEADRSLLQESPNSSEKGPL